eukprot:5932927-Amphidinium_carterae.1
MDSPGVFALLLHYALCAHKKALSQRADQLLRLWLTAIYNGDVQVMPVFPIEPPQELHRKMRLCVRSQEYAQLEGGYCPHCVRALQKGLRSEIALDGMVSTFASLWDETDACE